MPLVVAALDRIPEMRCVLGLFEGVVTGAADGYARMAEKPACRASSSRARRGQWARQPTQPDRKTRHLLRENLRLARQLLGGTLPTRVAKSLETLFRDFHFSLSNGELQFISSSGLGRLT